MPSDSTIALGWALGLMAKAMPLEGDVGSGAELLAILCRNVYPENKLSQDTKLDRGFGKSSTKHCLKPAQDT